MASSTPSVNARAHAALVAAADAADEQEFIAAAERLQDAQKEFQRSEALLAQAKHEFQMSHDSTYFAQVHSNSSPTPPSSPPKPATNQLASVQAPSPQASKHVASPEPSGIRSQVLD